jgi:hypothetical protein
MIRDADELANRMMPRASEHEDHIGRLLHERPESCLAGVHRLFGHHLGCWRCARS